MFRLRSVYIVPLIALLSSGTAHATTFLLSANLTTSQENPPTNPTTAATGLPRTSFGTATFVLNDAVPFMTFTATITGLDFGGQSADLNDDLLNAHIHAGPAVTPTTNGPVVWGFFGAPLNDINPSDVVITKFASGVGGTISGKWDAPEGNGTTLALQIANILAGRSYINFHSSQFTGGEIRGNIFVTAVPEPATMAMLGLGLVGLMARRRRS